MDTRLVEPVPAMPPKLKTDEDTVRVQIVAPESWVQRVEDFRAGQRVDGKIPNASAVIRQLVDEALDARERATKAKP